MSGFIGFSLESQFPTGGLLYTKTQPPQSTHCDLALEYVLT